MLILAVRFLSGQFQSTPWDEHVNGGGLEWPPSPWRVLRAIVTAGLSTRDPDWTRLNALVHRFAQSPPIYHSPPVTIGRWPRDSGPPARRGAAPVVAVGGDHIIYLEWPDISLSSIERGWLESVLRRVGHLGAPQSRCAMRTLDAVPQWGPDVTSLLPHSKETGAIRLLAPRADATLGDLTMTVDEIRGSHHRSRPAATQFVPYPRLAAVWGTSVALPMPAASRGSATNIAGVRFGLHGARLPEVAETAPVAEGFRAAAESLYGKLYNLATSPVLSGHEGPGIRRGHGHAHYLPLAESGDHRRIDRVLVWAPDGFTTADLTALAGITRVYFPKHTRLAPLEVSVLDTWSAADVAAMHPPADGWVTTTPFLPARHPHRRRNPDGSVRWSDTAEDEILRELRHRGWPLPIQVEAERTPSAASFRSPQRHTGSSRPPSAAFHVALRFEKPMSGPLVLGQWAHIGLGRFCPMEVQ